MTHVSLLVAGTELRRTVRAVSTERTKLAVMGLLAAIMLGPITAVGAYVFPSLGAELADGVSAENARLASDFVTGGIAIGWLVLVFMAVLRAFSAAADPDKPAFLLTSTSLRNVVTGVVVAEIGLFAIWVLPPTIILAGAFAYGSGTILPVLLVPVVALLVLGTAVPVGFVIGIWIRHLVTVYEPIARYRWFLFGAFWLLYLGVFATGRIDSVTRRLFSVLHDSPLGWPGHLLLVAVPNVPASNTLVLGALVGSLLVSAVGFAVGIASARVHWFADPVRFEGSEESTGADSSNRLADVLSLGLSRPVRTVTVTAIRRTKRAPIRLAYVGYPLLGSIGFVQVIIETGTVPSFVAVLLSLYVVWAAGALFTLNPLGDLGRALPAVISSPLSGRQAIAGLVIAGALVAGPIALVVSIVLGVGSQLSLEQTGVLVAVTTVGAVATPALATGIGSAAPRFGSVNVTNNREAVMPSKTAFLLYSLAIMLPAGAAAVLYTDSPAFVADMLLAVSGAVPGPDAAVSARAIRATAWTILVIGIVAPPVSFRYAVERFDWYTLE